MIQALFVIAIIEGLAILFVWWYAKDVSERLQAHRDNDEQYKLSGRISEQESKLSNLRYDALRYVDELANAIGWRRELPPAPDPRPRWVRKKS